MTVLATQISCFDTTWNPTFGCTKVSPGCDNCYAEGIANRFHGGFGLRLQPKRLADVRRFGPLVDPATGTRRPRRVFVNSMSDLFHRDVPDAYLDTVFEAIATQPDTVFCCLTKRPERLRGYAESRWGNAGVPGNVWLGVSVELDAVRARIDALRALKDRLGDFTAFLSVEPLLGLPVKQDYAGMDWIITGGESGARARRVQVDWVRAVLAKARAAGAAPWFRAWGRWEANPLWAQANGSTRKALQADLVAGGLELLPAEHGGATLDGALVQELPASWHRLVARVRMRPS